MRDVPCSLDASPAAWRPLCAAAAALQFIRVISAISAPFGLNALDSCLHDTSKCGCGSVGLVVANQQSQWERVPAAAAAAAGICSPHTRQHSEGTAARDSHTPTCTHLNGERQATKMHTRHGTLSRAATDADRLRWCSVRVDGMSRKGELCFTLPLEQNTIATCSHLFLGGVRMDYTSHRPDWSWYYAFGFGADHKTDQTNALEGVCENNKRMLCMSSYACA